MEVDGTSCTLDILDTALLSDTIRQEEYADIRGERFNEGKGFTLVYDITNKDSFAQMQSFMDAILAARKAYGAEPCPIALVGNKVDLEDRRAVSTAEGEDLLKKWKSEHSEHISGFMFIETSAKNKVNVSFD